MFEELEQLRSAVAKLAVLARKQHYHCEDGWYSCPLSPEGCANEELPEECNCGAAAHNERVDEILRKLHHGEMEPVHPMQPLVRDDRGTVRFKRNAIVDFLVDADTKGYNLNDLARMDFSKEDWEQLAQLIGYSVGGFCDLSYPSESAKDIAWERMEKMGKK